jgi:HEAT repeat protein
MKRRRHLLAGTVFFLAVVLLIRWSISAVREPVYKGQRLGLWLSRYSSGHSTSEVDDAVREMGTNCIPLLLRWLSARPRGWTNQLGLRLPVLDGERIETRREQAVQAFDALGEEAWMAVPALIDIFQQSHATTVERAAARALSAIGPSATNAVPCLLRGTTNVNLAVRSISVSTLSQIRSSPQEVVPVLIRCLNDADQETRNMATFALACYGKDASSAVPALLEKLKDPYDQVRGNAIWALAEAHAAAALAVPALTAALEDPKPFVRGRAARLLRVFGPDALSAGQALEKVLGGDADQDVRNEAQETLRLLSLESAGAGREP